MRVLITGGAGYIGTSLITHLLHQGHEAVCLDPHAHELPALLDFPEPNATNIEAVVGSVLDGDLVARLARSCDGIVHLAALVGAPACDADPEQARRLNIDGTRSLVAAAPRDIPLVVASTCSVYGRVRAAICTEEEPTSPLSLYAETKAVAERLVTERGGVALRFVTLYGVSPRFRWDLLLHTFLRLAARGERLDLFDPGAYRPLLHVHDAARALLFSLEQFPRLSGSIFNVACTAPALTKLQLAESIRRFVPFEINMDAQNFDPDQRDYRVSSEKIEAMGYWWTVDFDRALPIIFDRVCRSLGQENQIWPFEYRCRRSA
ncbi:NAD-dependent epimerase/dehydratase family protein [Methylobacterium nodulans]|uniref:NAD-dependent epimerase/dehydratase n=1 Tax=Methylobacterium nodulans (strain LMG 21967 / CNCM I-2342 / ORS 2060) TaxID=460265 RepID=B8IGJ7_METNO|nr:SDR family oxidoreductase [Methylobacterium nodulans]ACL55897.1 NAD-dependent epimerase/dehydratase [Methylobacterium nodulans ORS 2060]